MLTKNTPLAERLLSRIEIDSNGCWLFTGYIGKNGYGQIWRNGKKDYAHRVAFELLVRPLHPGESVCHSCDVPTCVNPDHLFAGSQADNARDMHAKGRSRGQFTLQPVRHGTVGGANAHYRRGIPLCEECRTARNARDRQRRRLRTQLNAAQRRRPDPVYPPTPPR